MLRVGGATVPSADMRLPAGWTDQFSALKLLEQPWRPVPRTALIGACVGYGLFLMQLVRGSGLLLVMDLVFVPIHEGGHLLFSYFPEFIMVAGGTLMQLGVPLMLGSYFALQRQVQGTTFCLFFFFEQFLPTARYMADARAEALPLLSVGDSDTVIHDWNYLFGRLGCLNHDIQIAHFVRDIGWLGMVMTLGWMVWRSIGGQPAPSADGAALQAP